MKNIALILASGTGSRCNLGYPKQFAKVGNKTILEFTIDAFENHPEIDDIYIVTSNEFIPKVKNIIMNSSYKKIVSIIEGGETRKESSYNGISKIHEAEANILIHDGVRPLISQKIITNCIETLQTRQAVCTAINSTDTIYETNKNNIIKSIPLRKYLRRAQTPQCFKLSIIKKAHELAYKDPKCTVTDDCGLIQYFNLTDIYLIEGDPNNIKITYKEDLEFVKKFFNVATYK
jgi:2-C-methyl-D-erythritol 4-phosphate cytidylyltransferase